MIALQKVGIASVLMHFRGCGTQANRLPRAYHSGDTQDAKEFIGYIKSLYPTNPLYGIGYSLGGNMLLKLLGEEGSICLLDKAVSICAPLKLADSAKTINKGFARVYEINLLKNLKFHLKEKYKIHPLEKLLNFQEKDINKIKSIYEFDDVYTAKIHGFGSAKNYYKLCSAYGYLKDIQKDTLLIHAQDDPFMSFDVIPKKEDISASVRLVISKHGGHVGFVGGSIFKPSYWLEERIILFLS